MPVAELQKLDRVLVVGSFLRKDHPLIAHRLRQAAKRGAQIHMLHSVDDDWLMPIASKKIVAAVGNPSSDCSRSRKSLKAGKNAAVLLGNFAQQHPAGGADPRRGAGPGRQGRLPRRSGELGRRLPRRPARRAATSRDVLEQKKPRAAQRRARARLRRPARRRCKALKDAEFVVSLTLLQDRPRVRRRAAADRAVHRDLGHVREHRGPRAELPRHRAPAGRHAPRLEGAARARQPARPAGLRVRHRRAGARRLPGRPGRCRRLLSNKIDLRGQARREAARASSASPTCRSTSPTRWCAARRRCRRRATRGRRAPG